jgi:Starch synthase catalytic domain
MGFAGLGLTFACPLFSFSWRSCSTPPPPCTLTAQVFDETEPADLEVPKDQTGKRYKKINWLKAGFLTADKLLTVSPNYADEISRDEAMGVELDDVIRYGELERDVRLVCFVPLGGGGS